MAQWVLGWSPDFLTARQVSNFQICIPEVDLQVFNPSFWTFGERLESRKTLESIRSSPRAYPIISHMNVSVSGKVAAFRAAGR